jgi:hypothetical protein
MAAYPCPAHITRAFAGGHVARSASAAAATTNTRAPGYITYGTEPALAGFIAFANFCAIDLSARALAIALFVARNAGIARVADTDAAVGREFLPVCTPRQTVVAHPSFAAIAADGHLPNARSARPLLFVAISGAIRDLATDAAPGCITGTLLGVNVAKPIARAVDSTKARAAPYGTELARPSLSGAVVTWCTVTYRRRRLSRSIDALAS